MLPNIKLATVQLLKNGGTRAGVRVYPDDLPRTPSWPAVTVIHEGSRQTVDIRIEEARIGVQAYGRTQAEARRVSYEVRDVILPPLNIVEGVHGEVLYTDEEGFERRIMFSGATLESGPRVTQDMENRIITYYLIQYF